MSFATDNTMSTYDGTTNNSTFYYVFLVLGFMPTKSITEWKGV